METIKDEGVALVSETEFGAKCCFQGDGDTTEISICKKEKSSGECCIGTCIDAKIFAILARCMHR